MSCGEVETVEGKVPLHMALLQNLPAAASVAMVSIPLSIALGIASGSRPAQGLAAAILGGLVSGLAGSSSHNIVGCADALAPLLMVYSQTWGPEVLPLITIGGGLVIFVCWATNLQKYMLFLPHCVFQGFSIAVGMNIAASQMHNAMKTEPEAVHKHLVMVLYEGCKQVPNAHHASVVMALVLFVFIFIAMKNFPRVPWMAVATVVSLPFGYAANMGYEWAPKVLTLDDKFGILSAKDLYSPVTLPDGLFSSVDDYQGLASACFAVAFVAILETLISAKIGTIRTGHKFDEAQEVLGLSLSTLSCGLVGAMIPCGVFVRTSINIQNGATHKIAAFMNGVWVAAISAALLPVFGHLPVPTVAAILFTASARMVPWSYISVLTSADAAGALLLTLTTVCCVAIDCASGLVVGAVLALLMNARQENEARMLVERDVRGEAVILRPLGPVTYVVAEKMVEDLTTMRSASSGVESADKFLDRQISDSPDFRKVLSLTCVTALDLDGAEALGKVFIEWQSMDIGVAVCGFNQQQHAVLEKVNWFIAARRASLVVEAEEDALVKVAMHMTKEEKEQRKREEEQEFAKQPLMMGA